MDFIADLQYNKKEQNKRGAQNERERIYRTDEPKSADNDTNRQAFFCSGISLRDYKRLRIYLGSNVHTHSYDKRQFRRADRMSSRPDFGCPQYTVLLQARKMDDRRSGRISCSSDFDNALFG